MPPRSHLQKFIDVLAKAPANKLDVPALADALGPPWNVDTVEQKARQFDEDESLPLYIVRGGLQYFGTERCKEPALYKQLQRGIVRSWATKARIPRVDEVYITCRAVARGDGEWTTPDLVISSLRAGEPELHAIEAEQPAGFDVRSVYQAYEQGRGARYAWVFYSGARADDKVIHRVKRAARELGVGVVHAGRPSQPSKWDTLVGARPRDVTVADARALRARLGIVTTSPQPPQIPVELSGASA